MYGYVWELLYAIKDMGIGKCDVSLRVIGERKDKVKEIRREFALLETILNGGVNVTIVDSCQLSVVSCQLSVNWQNTNRNHI